MASSSKLLVVVLYIYLASALISASHAIIIDDPSEKFYPRAGTEFSFPRTAGEDRLWGSPHDSKFMSFTEYTNDIPVVFALNETHGEEIYAFTETYMSASIGLGTVATLNTTHVSEWAELPGGGYALANTWPSPGGMVRISPDGLVLAWIQALIFSTPPGDVGSLYVVRRESVGSPWSDVQSFQDVASIFGIGTQLSAGSYRFWQLAVDSTDLLMTQGEASNAHNNAGTTVFFHYNGTQFVPNASHSGPIGRWRLQNPNIHNGLATVMALGRSYFGTPWWQSVATYYWNDVTELWEKSMTDEGNGGGPPLNPPLASFPVGWVFTHINNGSPINECYGVQTSLFNGTLVVSDPCKHSPPVISHGLVWTYRWNPRLNDTVIKWEIVKRLMPEDLAADERFGLKGLALLGTRAVVSSQRAVLDVIDVVCGNGFLDEGEECDDGNIDAEDGCDSACMIEFCGDGIQNNNAEQCDDGATSDGDGCTSTCMIEFCGDGKINNNNTERCDHVGDMDGVRCDEDCQVVEFCGDGIINLNETCDLGLTVNGTHADGAGCTACQRDCDSYCPSSLRQFCNDEDLALFALFTSNSSFSADDLACECREGYFGDEACSEATGAYVSGGVILAVSSASVCLGVTLTGSQAAVPAAVAAASSIGKKTKKVEMTLAVVKKPRVNKANVLAVVSLGTEFLQLLTFAFDPAMPWRGAGTENLGPFLALSQLSFVGVAQDWFPSISWRGLFWTVFSMVVLFVSYGMFLAVKLSNGLPLVTVSGIRNNRIMSRVCSLNLPILTLVSGPGLLPIVRNMLAVVDCTGPNDDFELPVLDVEPSLTCWEGDHLTYVFPALVAFAAYFPLVILLQPSIQDYNQDLDIKWKPWFLRLLLGVKTGLAVLVVFFGSTPWAGYLVSTAAMLGGGLLAVLTWDRVVLRVGSVRKLQHFRTVGFSLVCWSGFCGLLFTLAAAIAPDTELPRFAMANLSWALALTWWAVTVGAVVLAFMHGRKEWKARQARLLNLGVEPNAGSRHAPELVKAISTAGKQVTKSSKSLKFDEARLARNAHDILKDTLKEVTKLETLAATELSTSVKALPWTVDPLPSCLVAISERASQGIRDAEAAQAVPEAQDAPDTRPEPPPSTTKDERVTSSPLASASPPDVPVPPPVENSPAAPEIAAPAVPAPPSSSSTTDQAPSGSPGESGDHVDADSTQVSPAVPSPPPSDS